MSCIRILASRPFTRRTEWLGVDHEIIAKNRRIITRNAHDFVIIQLVHGQCCILWTTFAERDRIVRTHRMPKIHEDNNQVDKHVVCFDIYAFLFCCFCCCRLFRLFRLFIQASALRVFVYVCGGMRGCLTYYVCNLAYTRDALLVIR